MAEGMSPAWASPTRGPLRGLMVISALWRCFSTASTTLVSNLLPRILRILVRPDSTSLRMAGVTSKCLPVYSTFMAPPHWDCCSSFRNNITCTTWEIREPKMPADAGCANFLLLYSALVCARDAHVFPVFRNRAASDLYPLGLQDAGDLLVGERPGWIFFFDEFLDAAFQDEQRSVAALGTVDAFAEEVPQFKHALGGVRVFAGHGTADGGGMHADFFGHLLDHHGL